MVDVIMVLLVFFLLGTSLELTKHGVLQTELDPSSGPGGGARVEINPQIRIALADVRQGAAAMVFCMEEPLGENAFDELAGLLRNRRVAGADPKNPVVIGAETEVRWNYVVKAMDAAVRAGFENVQFAVSMRTGSLGIGGGAGPN
jgi:biopolymer transport protein ExbD